MSQMPLDLRDSVGELAHSLSEPENPRRVCHSHPCEGRGGQAYGCLLRGQLISESVPHTVHTEGAGFLPTQE
jgi:hypothetical protein